MSFAEQYHRFRDGFAEAMDGEFQTIEELDRQIANGEVQFWPGRDAAVCTQLVPYPGGARVIQCLWASGDMGEIINELTPAVESWARSVGCNYVLIEGRPGWAKMLRNSGYSPWSVTIKKGL